MNFGRGVSIPQENGFVQNRDCWIPVTPDKPIPPRSNLIPVDMQGNQLGRSNWQELLGIYSGFLQESTNYDGAAVQNFSPTGPVSLNGEHCNWDVAGEENQNSNGNVVSGVHNFGNDSGAWKNNPLAEFLGIKNAASVASANGTQNKSIHVRNRPTVPNSYTQVESNWIESQPADLMLTKQNHTSGLQQLPTDGFPVPYLPNCCLHSPPRSEAETASSVTNSFQFAPVTPDQAKQLENQQISEILSFLVDDISSQEKDKQENLAISIRNEDIENRCDELLRNIVDSSSAAISTTLKENISDEGDERGIDLNKTPELKAPKRRKHRPKVVIEGKPKRTPKPAAAKNSTPKENPSGKRKYVRKKGLQTSETQQTNATNEVTVPTVGPATKSCRRALNFDLENGTRDECQDRTSSYQAEMHHQRIGAFNLNLNSQDTKLFAGINSVSGTSTVHVGQQKRIVTDNNQAGTYCNLHRSVNQMPGGYIFLQEERAPTRPPDKVKDHTLNVIARNFNMRNANLHQSSGRNCYSQVHQHISGERISQNVFQTDTKCPNIDRTRQPMLQSTTQLVRKDIVNFDERRGSKRDYRQTTEQIHPCTVNPMVSPILCQIRSVDYNRDGYNFVRDCSETHKRKKTENGIHAAIPRTPCITDVKDYSRQVETGGINGAYANNATSQISGRLFNAYSERENTYKQLLPAVNGIAGNWRNHPMATDHNFMKKQVSSEVQPHAERMPEERSLGSTQVHDFSSLAAMTNWNQLSTIRPGYHQGIETCRANTTAKRQTMESTSSNQGSCGTEKMIQQQRKDALEGYQQSSTKARGSLGKQKFPFSVDEITYQLKGLTINGRSNGNVRQEQFALVAYKGGSTIVPYNGFDPIKKRKPRPKVDLDPETDRIWNLLMGKEGSDATEARDKDKEKWWEEERKVFRGRADSFIARMHLVQGDRRFSPWKGSVVDSVIGVFLTQNVSDHLSSSAFMSLAAKFPPQSTTTTLACYQNGTTGVVEEPDIQILYPNGSIKYHESTKRQTVHNQSSITSCESPDYRIKNLSLGRRGRAANEQNRIADEEIISSQNSSDSLIFQTYEEIRSSSGSNSEAEDRTSGSEPNKNHGPTPINLLQREKATMFKELYSNENGSFLIDERPANGHQQSENPECNRKNSRFSRVDNLEGSSAFICPINSSILHRQESSVSSSNFQLNMAPDSGEVEVQCFGVLGEESTSYLPSTASGITKAKGVNHISKGIGNMAGSTSKTTAPQNVVPKIQAATPGPYAFLSKHLTHQGNLQPGPYAGNNQSSTNYHQQERTKAFQPERTVVTEPIGRAAALAKRQNGASQQAFDDRNFTGQTLNTKERISVVDKQNFENKATEVNVTEQIFSSGEASRGTGTNISNLRKGKPEDKNMKAFDWDSLRKRAQSNGKRERSKDTMDSLNYEAVRCANVNEISDAIKERGMNNMLAERMKDFLNRLVREHGSIDLEWLRDVPPDQAKDYLLSFRGLGLKSVECVRLLTLHHLAFPVDTNVGRIAVRLGWVPLQPLPESLQLHLLELYPMLESIQKYLWPRLCKLDQRTLYELHYQMITFGKVFCTKNKPNCNACPMRGECRHFASAFASARLALPGPEDRSIVSPSFPIATDSNPAVAIKPMPLPPAENNSNTEAAYVNRKCEPIIEEPTTPEPETTEVTESDIEDAFYEDPDEIPTINLNIEEFTLNLQNYMQDNNMELQEVDMSKALVALNPAAASIPTPKLKNVSRLRTEHQVYELPDSHPLVKQLDKREPDDPSPYLLSIWTPGETANSVQPPESRCWAQESGKLCNDSTCFSCNSVREANSQTVRGTLLIPCRTAMRGSFPLNGTYFQVNEVFADHESSLNPIDVPRAWLWNLPRRTVYFGTSVSTIFKGLTTEGVQYCFWRGFVCVRGFDQKTRAPRPLIARLHFPASKLVKEKK